MSNRLSLSPRDRGLLQFLSWTPATTVQLLRASASFEGGSFLDDRRLRERLSALAGEGHVRSWSAATGGGGLQNYYKLTPGGYALLHGKDCTLPPRSFFAEIAPSTFAHTLQLAEAVVAMMRSAYAKNIRIERFYRENELTFEIGENRLQPDFFVRLECRGSTFHLAFEIDTGQESVDSSAANSVRRKLSPYHSYQDHALAMWHAHGKQWDRPRFRAVFLTSSTTRSYHILALAAELKTHRSRRLVYATTHSTFDVDADALTAPIFLDHLGRWQALVDPHPTSRFLREPVRLSRSVEKHFAK